MNISTDPEIIDNVIQNTNLPLHIIDHPMKPFGMRYWENKYERTGKAPVNYFYTGIDDFLEKSPQACSWVRDQEYMVDFKYYENLELKDGGTINYLHVFPKVRSVLSQYLLTNLNGLNPRDPPPQNETWTNKVCRPGNSTYTVVNANCYQGICKCNPGYFASLEKDFCHYCPSPKTWNHLDKKCNDKNQAENDCNPFNLSCTSNNLTVSIFGVIFQFSTF